MTAGRGEYFVKAGQEKVQDVNSNEVREEAGPRTENTENKKPAHSRLNPAHSQLEMKPLWEEFNELGTEMIVTKAGRRMFENSLEAKIQKLVQNKIIHQSKRTKVENRYHLHPSKGAVVLKNLRTLEIGQRTFPRKI